MKNAWKLSLIALGSILLIAGSAIALEDAASETAEAREPSLEQLASAIGIADPQPVACDSSSHASCIGKANGAACDENGDGRNGTCVMIHPSSECICDEPAPATCNGDSHRSCIGKADGAACDEDGNGQSGTCVMAHPTEECLCDDQ